MELAGRHSARRSEHGMTVLELMVVLAVITLLVYGMGRGLRKITKGDLVDDTLELGGVLRRASALAVETGQLHRVVFDFEHNAYAVEVCEGAKTIQYGGKADADRPADPRKVQDQMENARRRLATAGADVGAGSGAVTPAADDAARAAAAIAGQHVLDRVCSPAVEEPAPDRRHGKDRLSPIRKLNSDSEVKLHEIWLQHLDESVTTGTAVLYYFPNGSAEKAVIEVSAGDDTFTILVHGLSGRVEILDGAYKNPEDHLMRDIEGDKEADR